MGLFKGDKSEEKWDDDLAPLSEHIEVSTPVTGAAELAPVPAPVTVVTPAEEKALAEPVDLDKELGTIARRIKSSKRRAAAALLEMGQQLAEAQDLLAHHRGGSFGKFVRERCGLSTSAAYRAIETFKQFGTDAEIAKMIEPDALVVLSRAPAGAIEEARAFALEGSMVSVTVAKQFVREHKQPVANQKDDKPAPIILDTPGGKVVVHPNHAHVSVEQILAAALKSVHQQRKAA